MTPDYCLVAPPLDHAQVRKVWCTATFILVEAYAAGTLYTMNNEILRCRAEYHLGWFPNSLESAQARTTIFQTRCNVLSRIDEAAASVAIRYAVLGLALDYLSQP
ncbi:hypothetical protein BDN71DRAFT_1594629 [Pleurotus eryngii]|uniref:Uncharacterized protein n=1 Tax=Pleurotus eryngii TaxID=5323 RepID=A0A9P5ZHC9_PLEER|nr:hypothetical protein BDN71DRAFT_1594629 [Pleurotus eryngii]